MYQPRALCAVAPHLLPGLRCEEDVWRGFRAPPRAQVPRPASCERSIAPRWQLLGPAPTITGEQAVPIAALSLYFTNMPWGAFFHQPTQQIPRSFHASKNDVQNVSALLRRFVSDMFRPVVLLLAAKVHRAERLLQRATQEARQACVENNNKVAQASASWLSAGCFQRQIAP